MGKTILLILLLIFIGFILFMIALENAAAVIKILIIVGGLSCFYILKEVFTPKPKPPLSQSLQEAKTFFKATNRDATNDLLFDTTIDIANALGVEYSTLAHLDSEFQIENLKGIYLTNDSNTILLDEDLVKSGDTLGSVVLLHELIHAVTFRVIMCAECAETQALLSPKQLKGYAKIYEIYHQLALKYPQYVYEEGKNMGIYGLKDVHEFVSELAQEYFRNFLEQEGVYDDVIDAYEEIIYYPDAQRFTPPCKNSNPSPTPHYTSTPLLSRQ